MFGRVFRRTQHQNSTVLTHQFDAMAYKGEWRSGLEFIARTIRWVAVRMLIEAKRSCTVVS